MTDDPIQTAAEEIAQRTGSSAREIAAILRRNLHTSGLDRMTVVLRTPWPWVAGVIGVWTEGFLPQTALDKILVGVTLGAAVEAIGTYLQEQGLSRPAAMPAILTMSEVRALKDPETAGMPRKLIVGSVQDIQKVTHYHPPVRGVTDDELWQQAIRHAINNPRFARLIV